MGTGIHQDPEKQRTQELKWRAEARQRQLDRWLELGSTDALRFIDHAADTVPREMICWALLRISSRVEQRDGFKNETRIAVHRWLRGGMTIAQLRSLAGKKLGEYQNERGHTVNVIRDEDPYQSWCLLRTADAVRGAAASYIEDLIDKGYFFSSPMRDLDGDGRVHYRGHLEWPQVPIAVIPIPLLDLLPCDLADVGPAPKMWRVLLAADPDLSRYRVFTGEHLIFSNGTRTAVCWVGDRAKPSELSVLFDYLLESGGEEGAPHQLVELAEKVIWTT